MSLNIFYQSYPFLICLGLIGVLIAMAEIGFWVKKKREKDGSVPIDKADIALILGGIITLLALLLGFTYGMSVGRFETRRQLVIDEANAIGTTFLRAKTLPEPRSSEIQKLLRQYVALRVEIAGMKDDSPENIRTMDNRSKQLQDLLWSEAAALARENTSPVVAVFLQTLNEMIDIHTKRLAEFYNRVPFSIYLVLFITSAITLGLAGFYFGFSGPRARVLTTILAFLVASVMWLVMDLDQPAHGTIRASQQSLIDLNRDLNPTSRDTVKMF